jgi:hypothetical protein
MQISIILGFWLPSPASNISFTVYVHGPKGFQDLPLRNNGKVMLDTGGLRREATIGSNGEALFPEISASFRGQDVPVLLDAKEYELARPDTTIHLAGGRAYVEVHRKAGRIAGYVHDSQSQPVTSASVSIGELATSTDPRGRFVLHVPGEQIQDDFWLVVMAPGFATWRGKVVPDSNDTIVFLEKQKQP